MRFFQKPAIQLSLDGDGGSISSRVKPPLASYAAATGYESLLLSHIMRHRISVLEIGHGLESKPRGFAALLEERSIGISAAEFRAIDPANSAKSALGGLDGRKFDLIVLNGMPSSLEHQMADVQRIIKSLLSDEGLLLDIGNRGQDEALYRKEQGELAIVSKGLLGGLEG